VAADLTIRPTAKYLKAGTVLTFIVVLGLEIAYYEYWRDQAALSYLPMVCPVLLLWPAIRWIRRRFTRALVSGDRLRYESGATSRSTRTIQLTKVQDIRVDQSLLQRMLGIGNISIETSGESSRLTLVNIDRPQAVADELMNRAQIGAGGPA
jgi:membrane protein YdbS with pleckstrin-like domain